MANLSNVFTANKVVPVVAAALVGAAIAVPIALAGVQGVRAEGSTDSKGASVDACSITAPAAVDAGRVLGSSAVTTAATTTSNGVTGGNGNRGSSGNATNGSINTSNNNNSGIGVQDLLDLNVGDVNVLNNLLNGNSVLNPVTNTNLLNGSLNGSAVDLGALTGIL